MLDFLKFLHLAAAIVWLGGMACLLLAVRPAALAVMEPKPRALLMVQIWRRFFNAVMACVVVLLLTGAHLYSSAYRGLKAAALTGAGAGLPLGWHLMAILGTLMFLIFGHIYFGGFKKFQRAVDAGEFPAAAAAAGQIHKLVVLNFVLGWLAVAAVKLVH